MDASITMIAATTINVRAIIVVITTITVKMTTAMITTTRDVAGTAPNSMTITDVNMTIDATATIVATTTTHVRMTGVAIAIIVNKTTTLTGIIVETPSNVPTCQQDTSNRGNRNTDNRQYNDNQHEDERANESRTTPRATVRVTDNSRLLESRDTRIPENVGTIARTADAPRKRTSPPQEGPTSRK